MRAKIRTKARKKPLQQRSQLMVEMILEATARVLSKRGYEGTNTNIIAETAGVSVGSIYQYFPNKDALIAALHQRMAQRIFAVIKAAIEQRPARTLHEAVATLVHAVIEAHLIDPALHRILESEFSFLDRPKTPGSVDMDIFEEIHALLERHRAEVIAADLRLATYIVIHLTESLVHAAVLEPPPDLTLAAIEGGIVDAILGYLTYRAVPRAARVRA